MRFDAAVADGFGVLVDGVQVALIDAQFRLGFMYEKGFGVDQSNQNAIDQYTKAVRNGSVDAQRALDRLASVKQ